MKGYWWWKCNFCWPCIKIPASPWIQIGHKLLTPQFADITSLSTFLMLLRFFCQFGYWSKFQVNIITGSWVTTNFFYKVLTRNAEIENSTICILSNIWRLGQVKDGKFGVNFSNESYWILQDVMVAVFNVSELL